MEVNDSDGCRGIPVSLSVVLTVGVLAVGVLTVGALAVGVLTVGVLTAGVLAVGVLVSCRFDHMPSAKICLISATKTRQIR